VSANAVAVSASAGPARGKIDELLARNAAIQAIGPALPSR
jgi:hypothetical protein